LFYIFFTYIFDKAGMGPRPALVKRNIVGKVVVDKRENQV